MKMNAGMSRMIQVSVTVLFIVHLMACFWFLGAKFEDFHPDTWVARLELTNSHHAHQYLYSCYW